MTTLRTTLKHALATVLALGAFALGLTQFTDASSAQSLEDALRQAEEPPGGRQSAPPPPPSGGAAPRRWGAVAAALWKRRGVVQVAVGSAIKYNSESEARYAALRQCRNAGGPNCSVKSTWSRGCGYITTGRNRRGAGWIARATYAKTMQDCRNQGYRCKRAIGGCVD